MWVDSDGVAHTVALPEPAQAMTEHFRRGLDALLIRERAAVEDALAEVEQQVIVALESASSGDWPVEQPAPEGLLAGDVQEVVDLTDGLAEVDLRWRLDAVLAVEDYIG